jgi:hypothetical protein
MEICQICTESNDPPIPGMYCDEHEMEHKHWLRVSSRLKALEDEEDIEYYLDKWTLYTL